MNATQTHGMQPKARTIRKHWLMTSCLVPVALSTTGIARANDLPTGGNVTAGAASIAISGNAATITQTSSRAVIDWSSFSVANGNSVHFEQPDVSAATLNRVSGSTQSTIAGQITANGTVYLVNPNGIVITSTGTVNTGGGFVASSLDISNDDFMAGNASFTGSRASNAVRNAGSIIAGQGAYVALLGGAVSNSGTITVPMGKLGLGSGEQVALDLNGGNFMQIAVPTALITRVDEALVDNSGTIVVTGGAVQLKAAVLKDAVRNVVNMSGSINADSATGNGGTIELIGGSDATQLAGDIHVSGTLSARASGSEGGGGSITTAGARLHIGDTRLAALAPGERAPTWSVVSKNLTVDTSMAVALNAALNSGNDVALFATDKSREGHIATDKSDVTISADLAWDSYATLTLSAADSVAVNANIAVNGGATVNLVFGATDLATGGLSFAQGASLTYAEYQEGQQLNINGNDYSLIYDKVDLEGLNGRTGRFALAHGLDLSTSSSGHVYSGAVVGQFAGTLEGLGNAINNLQIDSNSYRVGLIGTIDGGGVVRDINLIGGSVRSTGGGVGSLGGYSDGNINNVFANVKIAGQSTVGGLIGYAGGGQISNSIAAGSVSGDTFVGGLVGQASSALISNSAALGNVFGRIVVGGFAGQIDIKVVNSLTTGKVSGTSNVGAFVGSVQLDRTSFENVFSNSDTSGQSASIGSGTLAGLSNLTTAQLQDGSSASSLGSAWVVSNGLYPYLASFYPDGVQVVKGVATAANGSALAGTDVAVEVNKVAFGTGSTGGNGYYYIAAPARTVGGDNANVFTYQTDGSAGVALLQIAKPVGTGVLAQLDYAAGTRGIFTHVDKLSAITLPDLAGLSELVSSGNAALVSAINNASGLGLYADSATFTIDQARVLSNGDMLDVHATHSGAKLIVASKITMDGLSNLSLSSAGSIAVNADIEVTGGGKVALKFDPTTLVTGGLSFAQGASLSYADGQSGQALNINGDTYRLIYTKAGLEGINSQTGFFFALAHGLDLSTNSSGLVYDLAVVPNLRAPLEGLGNAISNLRISSSGAVGLGLIGTLHPGATLRDINVIGGSVQGYTDVGGLVGINSGKIFNASASSAVRGSNRIGGLVGKNSAGTISNSVASGTVSGGSLAGGFVGQNNSGTISDSLATGTVSGNVLFYGSFAGDNVGTIARSLGLGKVSGPQSAGFSASNVGGVNVFASSYWDINTSGKTSGVFDGTSGAVQGLTTSQLQDGASASGLGSAWVLSAGLYPYLASFYPDGVQVVKGFATAGDGSSLADAIVAVEVNKAAFGTGRTAANGYYYIVRNAGTVSSDSANIFTYQADGSAGVALLHVTNPAAQGVLAELDYAAGARGIHTTENKLSAVTFPDLSELLARASSDNTALISAINSASGVRLFADSPTFSIDEARTLKDGDVLDVRATHSGAKLIVANTITMSGLSNLSLSSAGTIAVNSNIYVNGGGKVALKFDTGAPITGGLSFAQGASLAYSDNQVGQTLTINNDAYTLIYDKAGLEGINNQTGRYALAHSLDLSDTTYTHAAVFDFSGTLEGAGNAIHNLTINNADANFVGLIADIRDGGAVRDLNLIGGAINGGVYVGGLIGRAFNARITNVLASVAVSGNDDIGGLIGWNDGAEIRNSIATGSVSGHDRVGGMVGRLEQGSILNSMATGAVTGNYEVGGLVGSSNSGIFSSLATGYVSGNSSTGGLAGYLSANSSGYNYWNKDTSGRDNGVGNGYSGVNFSGRTTADLQNGSLASGLGAPWIVSKGLYPYLASFYPNGVQVVQGTAVAADGNAITGASLAADVNGALFGRGNTGANGYYYIAAPSGTVSGNAANTLVYGIAKADGGALTGATYVAASVTPENGVLATVGLTASALKAQIAIADLSTNVDTAFLQWSDGSAAATNAISGATSASIVNSQVGGFTIGNGSHCSGSSTCSVAFDGGDLTLVATRGGITIQSGGVSASGNLTLASNGLFANNAGSGAVRSGQRWSIYSQVTDKATALPDIVKGGLSGANWYNDTYDFGTGTFNSALPANGNHFVYGYAAETRVRIEGTVTKPYDGTTTAPGSGWALSAANLLDANDSVAFGYDSASYVDSAVGAGKKIFNVSGFSIGNNPNNYTLAVGADKVTIENSTISTRPITVTYTANKATSVYGDALSGVGGTFEVADGSLATGDTLDSLGIASWSSSVGLKSGVGNYSITGSGLANGNYTITGAQAALNASAYNVTARPITVTADALEKVYGDALPELTYKIGGLGLANSDALTGMLSTPATSRSDVGSYAIALGALRTTSNYDLTFTGADMKVIARPITLTYTADLAQSVYGNEPALVSGTVTVTGGRGLADFDTLANLGTARWTANVEKTSSEGTYGIAGAGLANMNYDITERQAAGNASAYSVINKKIDFAKYYRRDAIISVDFHGVRARSNRKSNYEGCIAKDYKVSGSSINC